MGVPIAAMTAANRMPRVRDAELFSATDIDIPGLGVEGGQKV